MTTHPPSLTDYAPFLAAAQSAARAAEKIILSYYQGPIATELKADLSPVTAADREAETVIRRMLHTAFPEHGFIGEEFGTATTGSPFAWIIDPIDGTKNYARKIPLFATQIALLEAGRTVVGLSNAPAMREVIWAARGTGAHSDAGERLRVSTVETLSEAHVSVGGLNHFTSIGQREGLLRFVDASARSRAFGDAWAYHLVASGRLEAVVEAKVRIWDVAALALIIEEAGGTVTDIAGQPLGLESTTVVASNGRVHAEVLSLLHP